MFSAELSGQWGQERRGKQALYYSYLLGYWRQASSGRVVSNMEAPASQTPNLRTESTGLHAHPRVRRMSES